MKNLFTDSSLLANEAGVEDLFVGRLIRALGFSDAEIAHKKSIKPKKISVGSTKLSYTPDFILSAGGYPRVVIDAKSPSEDISTWIGQCVSYCATINRSYKDKNPVSHFVVSNGTRTLVFDVDHDAPVVDMTFGDFVEGNKKFQLLRKIISPKSLSTVISSGPSHTFQRLRIDDVNAAFSWCHQHIYKKDSLSQAAGFEEFVKLIFLKLLSDRSIKEKYPDQVGDEEFTVNAADVRFSSRWIDDREEENINPVDAIQFQTLLRSLEDEIRHKRKKRIFPEGAHIALHPGTVKEVVKKLESIYLFGIDADLNGRLFETFLSATMRGKDLGQFFTPRSVAKLGTKLALLKAGPGHVDVVLDGCCGTGGFLIDALADMWAKVDQNPTLSATDKKNLRRRVAEEAMFGVDIAQEPNLARLARMNMYLHGDGGSSIYEADFLDKKVGEPGKASPEVRADVQQLRDTITSNPDGFVDVVITNPPFAKVYDRKTDRESVILDEYELGMEEEKLKSSLMFFERYHDVPKVGGRLVTVIDDGILSGASFSDFRNYLLSKFLLKGVISLPGDAFQRSQARVKTSFVILEKRSPTVEQAQGPVFKYACRYVGIDDPNRQRTLPIDEKNRISAKAEITKVAELFGRFVAGDDILDEHIIPPTRLSGRLDAKAFEPTGRMVAEWKAKGIKTVTLDEMLEPVALPDADIIDVSESADEVTYLVVGYDGFAREGETISANDHRSSASLFRVHADQIVLSNINAVNGSICVVPKHLDGLVVTNEFTILAAKPGYDPRAVWAVLRSPEIRSELLLLASGAGRTRVKWTNIAKVKVPVVGAELAKDVVRSLVKAEKALKAAYETRRTAQAKVQGALMLATDRAVATLEAYKPPR